MVKVMGRILRNDRYKTVLAIKLCKIKFTEFRSDERRKVKLYLYNTDQNKISIINIFQILGYALYSRMSSMSTQALVLQNMKMMHALM